MEVSPAETEESQFSCEHVFIGAHHSGETLLLATENSITFWCDNFEGSEKKSMTLKSEDITKVVFCHSKKAKMLFLYPLPSVIANIKQSLGLSDEQMRVPTITSSLKRIGIVLQVSAHTEKLCEILEKFAETKFDEISCIEAKDLLENYQKYLPADYLEEVVSPTKPKQVTNNENSNVRRILTYPPTSSSGRHISLFLNDFMDLAPKTYLNDAIIDLYLQYVLMELVSPEMRERIHIFDSFFWKKLSTKCSDEETGKMSAEETSLQKYQRVAKWDEKVKLFEKDFIFVPININEHWLLAVICFPYLMEQKLNFETGEEIDPKFLKSVPVKQACLLIFDSLGIDRPNVSKALREYLRHRFLAEKQDDSPNCEFSSTVMPGCYVKVPRQKNYFDCGVFLLEYVEHFCLHPISDYRTPIKGLEKWFTQEHIRGKRKYLRDLIVTLVEKYEPENLPLPDIYFGDDEEVTNGELMEVDEIEKSVKEANNETQVP
ncbi:sentrin-specific protease 6-like [Culicoides brevitarsis]|uniref:sentrin-specific protease 6-like n=1 Tax=Culicoides brevitarsis TaxID=469753 RepID=UPI00307BDE9F